METYGTLKHSARVWTKASSAKLRAVRSRVSWMTSPPITGLTAGEGLGYSRALLFLWDEREEVIVGRLAVGAQTSEEADADWCALADRKQLSASDPFEWILNQALEFAAAVKAGTKLDCPL